MKCFSALLATVLAFAPLRIVADPGGAVVIDTTPAPVQVTSAFFFPLNNRVQWTACVSFVNSSSRLVTEVKFALNLADPFGTSIEKVYGDRTGVFSPGVAIDGPSNIDDYNVGVRGGSYNGANQKIRNCWSVYTTQGTPSKLYVGVERILFADGSVWSHGDPWGPSPAPGV